MMTPEYYLPPPTKCEKLAEIAARCGGTVDIRFAATRITHALPAKASEELREFLSASASVEAGAEQMVRLPGGRVFGSGNVLAPDGGSVARDVSVDFGKPFEDHWLLTYRKIRRPQLVDGEVAVIATTLGGGYGHWLLDELPRLLVLEKGMADTVIGHAGTEAGREAFALSGFAGAVIEPRRFTHFQCGQLIVPGLSGSDGQVTARGVGLITEFAGALRGAPVLGERIYVSRAKARRRRVVNEAALWSRLEARGFVKLHLEDLSWREQINAFRHAKVVVGPHGAGLANLVFCEAGTTVVELFNRGYVHGGYWQLASLKGLDYRPVVPVADGGLACAPGSGRLDIEVDVDRVMRAL